MFKKLLLLLPLLVPALCAGQGAPLASDPSPVIRTAGQGLQPVAYATITVCSVTGTGFPCTPGVPVYKDIALTQLISATGTFTTDILGNYQVFVAPGNTYFVTVQGTGLTPRSFYFQAEPSSSTPVSPGAPLNSLQFNNGGLFAGTVFLYNPTGGACQSITCPSVASTVDSGLSLLSTDSTGEIIISVQSDAVGNTSANGISTFNQTVLSPASTGFTATDLVGGSTKGGGCYTTLGNAAGTNPCAIGYQANVGDNPNDSSNGQDAVGVVSRIYMNKRSGNMGSVTNFLIPTPCSAPVGSCGSVLESANMLYGIEFQDQQGLGTKTAGIHFEPQTNPNNRAVWSILQEVGAYPNSLQQTTISQLTAPLINNRVYTNGRSVAAAFAASCGTGCIIDATGDVSAAALNLGTFDPGTVPVVVLLGPYQYTITQWTLRTAEVILGTGHAGTFITQAVNTTIPFTGPGTNQVYPANVINGLHITGINVLPAVGSTTDAFNFTAHAAASGGICSQCGGGLWYSTFDDINVASGFGGSAMHFITSNDGSSPESLHQFNRLTNVFLFRKQNGQPAFWFSGQGGQFTLDNCEIDGSTVTDTTANNYNIRIDDGGVTGFIAPYNFHFKELTSQNAWGSSGSSAIYLGGASSVTLDDPHFEHDMGIITEAVSAAGRGNWGTVINGLFAATNTGIAGGPGFVSSTDASSSLELSGGNFFATPDQIFIGASTKYVSVTKTIFNGFSGGAQPWTTSQPWAASDSGNCTMSSGACSTQNLSRAYVNGTMHCVGTWDGGGTLTGILKIIQTIAGGAGGVATVVPTSTIGSDTAHINWSCTGVAQ